MHIKIINYIFINEKHTYNEKNGQIFITKSKLGFLYTDLSIKIEYCFIFFNYYSIFFSIDNLIIAKN